MSNLLTIEQLRRFYVMHRSNLVIIEEDYGVTYRYTIYSASREDSKLVNILRILAGLARILPGKEKYPPILRYIVKYNDEYRAARPPFEIREDIPAVAPSKGLTIQPVILEEVKNIITNKFNTKLNPYRKITLQIQDVIINKEPYISKPNFIKAPIPIMYTYEAYTKNPIYVISMIGLFPHEILGDFVIITPDRRIYIVDIKQSNKGNRGLYISKKPITFKDGQLIVKESVNRYYTQDNILRFTIVINVTKKDSITVSQLKGVRRLVNLIYSFYTENVDYTIPIDMGDSVEVKKIDQLSSDKVYKVSTIS